MLMMKIISAITFSCLVGAVMPADELCKKVGPRCSRSGDAIEFCQKKGMQPGTRNPCPVGKICVDDKNGVRCEELNVRFQCAGVGEFPDPLNCSQTFICPTSGGRPKELCSCPVNSYVYPEQGLFCVPHECPRKDIRASEGSFGHFTLKNNQKTSFYYYFLSSNVVTVYDNVESDGTAQVPEARVNGKKCVPYREEPNDTPLCKKPYEIFPTECDCDFFFCNKDLTLLRETCYNGYRYSNERKTCVKGKCDESKCYARPRNYIKRGASELN